MNPLRVAWLLGAGASAAAGLPTASQIRDDLLLRVYAERHKLVRQNLHPNDPSVRAALDQYFNGRNGMAVFGDDDDYSRAFELALPDEGSRHQYLQTLLAGRQPSFGQRILGALISGGQTDVVVTTNFDNLIEQAAAASYASVHDAEQPRVLNVAGLGSVDRARKILEPSSWPLLIKLHGDFRESSLKNLSSELVEQDGVLRQAVRDLSRTVGLAVVGYSGRDESVMEMLGSGSDAEGAWPGGLWWFVRDPDRLPAPVLSLLDKAESSGAAVHLVRLETFDELMADIERQAELSIEAREYLMALQPPSRLVEASSPSAARQGYPVLRFNALPILGAPTKALCAPLSGIDYAEFGRRAREAEWRGVAVMAGGSLWGWGDAEKFCGVAGVMPESVDVDLTGGPLDSGIHALLVDGLTRAVAAALPARPRTTRRENLVLLAEWGDLDAPRREALALFKKTYDGRLEGTLPAKYGNNRRGKSRAWAEAARIHVEFRWGKPWLIFTPFTWVEPRARSEREKSPVDPVGEWVRERWVARKKNETWAGLIDAWCSAVAPGRSECTLPLTRAAAGETFGGFRIGPTSAYSWRAL